MRLSRDLELLFDRKNITPNTKEAKDAITSHFPRIHARILTPTQSERQAIVKGLVHEKGVLGVLVEDPALSRAATASYLKNFFSRSLVQRASRCQSLNDDPGTAFYVDLRVATFGALFPILQTARLDSDPQDGISTIVDAVRRVTDQEIGLGEQSDLYLKQLIDLARARILLNEDPTGTLLVEEAGKGIIGESNRYSSSISGALKDQSYDFLRIGVSLASESYRYLYPVTTSL